MGEAEGMPVTAEKPKLTCEFIDMLDEVVLLLRVEREYSDLPDISA